MDTPTCIHRLANRAGRCRLAIEKNNMAAAQSSLGETIKDDVTCTICLELITRPKMLPCQHTFCQECLQVLAGREATLECPYCRRPVNLPSEGVAGLPDNRLIASLCERLKKQELSEETREEFKRNRCSFHPSQQVQLYCKPCHLPVCELCLEETHDSHLTTTIERGAKDRKPKIQALIKDGRNIMETYSDLSEQELALNEQKLQTDISIFLAFNQMTMKLTERKDHLLLKVQRNHSKNMNRIQNGRVLRKELSDACDLAEQEMEHGGIRLLRQENILTKVVGKHHLDGEAAPTPVQTKPAVFQPTDTPVPILGHVKIPSLPPAPNPTETASSNTATRDTGQSIRHTHVYQETTSIGTQGQKLGEYNNPRGIAVSEEGEIFVADQENQRIQVIILHQDGSLSGRQFPTVLPDGQKISPNDMAMDSEENLWVVGDKKSADFAVQYNKQGNWVLRTIELQHTGWIRGIAVDTRRNHILITQTTGDGDNMHGEVLVFTPDGTQVNNMGAHGHGKWKKIRKLVGTEHVQQGMKFPQYIAVDEEGNILVSDCVKQCVYTYNEDGKFLFSFGGKVHGVVQLQDPKGICTDRSGNIIVADKKWSQSVLFDRKGKFLQYITVPRQRSVVPQAVAVTKQGHLVVTDCVNHQVVIYRDEVNKQL